MPPEADEWIQEERHCATLNLPPGARLADLKAAYRSQALLLHPDKNGDCPLAKEQFIEVKAAYDYLLPRWKVTGGGRGGGGRGRGRGRGSGERGGHGGGSCRGRGGFGGHGHSHHPRSDFNEFRPKDRPQFAPPPVVTEKTTRFKLSLTFEEFRAGVTMPVALKRHKPALDPATGEPLPALKRLQVRVPPGAAPGDTFFGYLMTGPRGPGGQPTASSLQDYDIQFVLADKAGQRFHRDPAYPGCPNLRHIVDVPAADWLALESGAVDHLLLRVPTIERPGDYITHRFVKTLVAGAGPRKTAENGNGEGDGGGGDGGGGDVEMKSSTDAPAQPPKLVKEFRLRGMGLPVTPWSPVRGDLIVFINVLQTGEAPSSSSSSAATAKPSTTTTTTGEGGTRKKAKFSPEEFSSAAAAAKAKADDTDEAMSRLLGSFSTLFQK